MLYSRWRPNGGYDYFEANDFAALGDDLPNPQLPVATKLGVPSVEVGHRLPALSWKVGSGDQPEGIIAPMDTSRLPSALLRLNQQSLVYIAIGGSVVAIVWSVNEWIRRKR